MEVIKKHKEVKEVEITDERYSLCDKCGKKITIDSYDAFDFTFIRKTGESYPDGGSGEKESLDLCEKCSEEVVLLLRENGYNVQKRDWDW